MDVECIKCRIWFDDDPEDYRDDLCHKCGREKAEARIEALERENANLRMAWEADLAFANEDGTSMNNQLVEANNRIDALERAGKDALAMMVSWQTDWYEMSANLQYRPMFSAETLALQAALREAEG